MPLARELTPILELKILEPGVGMGTRMNLGEVDALGERHDGPEHVVAADHHYFVDTGILGGAAGMREPLLKAARDDGARRRQTGIAGEHDIDALVENAGKGLKGAAPHEDGLAERHFPELLE